MQVYPYRESLLCVGGLMPSTHQLTAREVKSIARALRMVLKIEARLQALETQTSSRLTDKLRNVRYDTRTMLYHALGYNESLAGQLDPYSGEWV